MALKYSNIYASSSKMNRQIFYFILRVYIYNISFATKQKNVDSFCQ